MPAPKDPSMLDALRAQDVEIKRFLAQIDRHQWDREKAVAILIGHMGTTRAREMNDFLER